MNRYPILSPAPKKTFRRGLIPAALTLLAGTLFSAIAFRMAQQWERVRIVDDFQRDAGAIVAAIRTGIAGHLETLHFIREFYAGSDQVTRAEFETFVSSAIRRHRGCQALEWIPKITRAELAEYERTVQAEGFPDYHAHPATEGAVIYPVDYVVPYKGNEKAHGFNLASNPERLEALQRATDSGDLTATAPIRLVQEVGEQAGLIVFIPLYHKTCHCVTVEERRENLIGFIVGVFRVGDLIESALEGIAIDEVDLQIIDRSGGDVRLIFNDHGIWNPVSTHGEETHVLDMEFDASPSEEILHESINVCGRVWELTCVPAADHLAFHATWMPAGVLLSGMLITSMLAGYLLTLAHQTARIDAEVRQRTIEWSEANAQLDEQIIKCQRAEEGLEQNLARQMRLNRLLQNELPLSRTLSDKLGRVTEAIVDIFEADFCRIWIIKEGDLCADGCIHAEADETAHACLDRSGCLHLAASSGRYTHLDGAVHRRVPYGCYKIGRIAAGAELKFLTNDVQHDPRVHDHAWAQELGLIAFAGYRLCDDDGEPIGVLALFARRSITPEEDGLLESIAASTGHVIQAARAEERLIQAYADLETRVLERTAELAETNRALEAQILERERVENSLRDSEQRYRRLFEGLNDAAFLADAATGIIQETNRQGEALIGRSHAEIVGMRHIELYPPDKAEEYQIWFAAHAELGQTADFDGEVLRQDGRRVPVRISSTPLTLGGQAVVLNMLQDITERRRMEEEAQIFSRQQSTIDALLRFGLEQIPLNEILNHCLEEVLFNTWLEVEPRGAIFLVDEDDPHTLVLKAQQNLSEALREQCTRVPFGRCSCGHAAETGLTEFAENIDELHEFVHADMEPHGHYCVPIRSIDRTIGVFVVYVEAGHQRSEVEEMFLEAVAGTIAGIVQRKQTEEKLRLSEERHRAITETAQDAIITADHLGRVRLWNSAAEKIFGFRAAEIVGRDLLSFIIPPRYHAADHGGFIEFVRTGEGTAHGKTLEMTALRKDGAEFPVECSVSGYHDSEGRVTVALVRDISERVRAAAELAAAQKELLEASRRAGMADVASGVLHSVGNVLNSTNVAAQLAADRVRQLRLAGLGKAAAMLEEHREDLGGYLSADERGRQLPSFLARLTEHLTAEQAQVLKELQTLGESIAHIKSIVSMQQTYARASGVAEEFELHSLLEDALRMSSESFGRLGIEVVREFGPERSLVADRQKLMQILVNLIRNAKHALQDGAAPDKRLILRVTEQEGRLRVTVLDNGHGVTPENLSKLFTMGFTTKKDGHGFGLHSSALAAKELGGSLTVRSDGPDRGAEFVVELPLTTE